MWLAALAGCDIVLGFGTAKPPPDGPPDGPIDAPKCMAGGFHDDLTTPGPCGTWGNLTGVGNGTVAEGSGQLTITNTNNGIIGCQSNSSITLDEYGLFVKVDQPSEPPGGYMVMMLHDSGTTFKLQVGLRNNGLDFVDSLANHTYGTMAFSMATTSFVRIRPNPMTSEMVAEVSGDAANWKLLGKTTEHYGTMFELELSAGGNSGSAVMVTSVFSHLNTCP